MIGKGKDSFSYAPAASAKSDPSPEVAPTTVVSVITEYVSATPTAVPYLDEMTITIYTTFFEEVCTKTDTWTMDGTVFSSSYETVTTSSSIDFYNPHSPTAAPETTHCSHSDISVLTPAQSHEPIHPPGDSIVTSTSISIFLTTATETHLHTVRPTAGHTLPSAPVGQAALTHSTRMPFSFPSAAEHESGHMKPSHTRASWSSNPTHFEQNGRPSSAGALAINTYESPVASVAPPAPSVPAYESQSRDSIDTPWHSKATEVAHSTQPAAPSAPGLGFSSSFDTSTFVAPVPSTPVDFNPVPTTWVDESVTKFTSIYATVVPKTSVWTFKHSNITRTSTFLANSTITSVWSSTITETHTGNKSELGGSGNSTITHAPIPLGGIPGSGIESFPTKTPGNSSDPTTCSSKPIETDFCIPCEGQPGNDPNSFCGYTVHDDSYKVTPKTCRTVEYHMAISNTTIAPDGVPRIGLVINGQMPGPLIEASWGDTVVIHLENQLQDNGTSLHFHGLRQLGTNEMDGVPSITQCALAPGEKMTYTFVASNYGSTWYHSHFALQAYDGVFGPMTIHGPSSADYDIDTGFAILQDWGHETVDSQYHFAETIGDAPEYGPRVMDTGLINGMNVWSPDNGTTQTGSRFEMNFQPGKTHLIRVVNTAIQSTFKFHIDGHKFTVISADFVPIVPYETDILNVNIGQRYNILVKADQQPGNYWMRSDNQQACAQLHNSRDIKGIVHYTGFTGTPNTISREYKDECVDEPYEKLIPIAPMHAGPQTSEIHKNILVGEVPASPNLYKWTLDGNTFQSQWGDPTLGGIYWNDTVPSYSGNLAIEIPKLKEWVYIIVESPVALPHPIHLHGHDSLVLAQGTGPYSDDVVLKLDNPPRRDTALMPFNPETNEGGYLVIGFETDNPGAWL
jgi:FtsP/CotA-like multicopper oxidase with cupredoxin domain